MPETRRKSVDLSAGKIEIISLRAQVGDVPDYAPDLEDETWCRLHEQLPDKYGLRFLVRNVEAGIVTIGGIRVTDTLVIDNDAAYPPQLDVGVDADTFKELHRNTALDQESRQPIYLMQRCPNATGDKCRVCFRIGVGDCFEFQFTYKQQCWGGNVKLVGIKEEAGLSDEPAYLEAKFEVRFVNLDEDEEDEEDEDQED